MHTHITLVGGQTYPIFKVIKTLNPDKVIYIHSKKTKGEAERIANEFPTIDHTYKAFAADNMNKIVFDATKIFKNLEDKHQDGDTYSVNVTGGLKVWAIAFYNLAKDSSLAPNIYYIDQNTVLWNLGSHATQEQLEIEDVMRVMRINNNEPKEYIKFDQLEEEDIKVCKKIDNIMSSGPALYALLSKVRKQPSLKEWEVGKNSLKWDKGESRFILRIGNNETILKSKNVRKLLLNAGWFEYKVASFLSKWKRVKDIYIGVTFKASNNSSKNEIDIIANVGSKLLFVECKTDIANPTDLDKFKSAVDNYGGSGCMRLFIQNESIDIDVVEKCDDNEILCFSLKDSLPGRTVYDSLELLLENAINEVNTK